MRTETYNKNYSNTNLVIPANIWNNSKINGMQKMVLALLKKLTYDGNESIQVLTKMQAQMMSTHEKDIKYNLQQLHKKGFINMYEDIVSPSGYSLTYTYQPQPKEDNSDGPLQLF